MRILYITPESPLNSAGGIGTYIGYAVEAMIAAGHDVFIFTWTYSNKPIVYQIPFNKNNTHVEYISGDSIWLKYPQGPYNHAFSQFICSKITEFIDYWDIDVVEATDYLSPALMLFSNKQILKNKKKIIKSTFNHGFIDEVYLASHQSKSLAVACDLAGERQQCRFSDIVFTPSLNAKSKLSKYGISSNVELVYEPFNFDKKICVSDFNNSLTHLGRVSIAKGIDKLILFANIINNISPLERMLFIGKLVDTPFRITNIKEYITNRLDDSLSKKIYFTEDLNRDLALTLLRPGDIAPNFSLSETFSYSFLESLNYGLLPLAECDSAMSEFYPKELYKYLIDPRFININNESKKYYEILKNASSVCGELIEYNEARLSLSNYSNVITDIYQKHLNKSVNSKKDKIKSSKRKFTVEDITILMPVYKPSHEYYEAIDSIAFQTSGLVNVLICDDGNNNLYQNIIEYVLFVFPNAKIIRQTNVGLLCARNFLLSECVTPLAIFLDADDILDPYFIERSLSIYNETNVNAIIPMRYNFDRSDEKVLRILLADHVHTLTNDYRMTALIQTDILKEIGFDGSRRNGEADDWIFWLEFTLKGYRAATINEFLFSYRFKYGSMSWPWSEGQKIGTQIMLQEVLKKAEKNQSFLGSDISSVNMFNNITN